MRSKKLCSIDVDEKLKLGRELRQMDREQDKLEAELSSYQDKEVFNMKQNSLNALFRFLIDQARQF